MKIPIVKQLFKHVGTNDAALRELSEKSGVGRVTLWGWRMRVPTLDKFIKACEAAGFEVVLRRKDAENTPD